MCCQTAAMLHRSPRKTFVTELAKATSNGYWACWNRWLTLQGREGDVMCLRVTATAIVRMSDFGG